jgi:alanyl-tRNA synthetase
LNLDDIITGLPKTELLYLREMQLRNVQANVIRTILDKRTHFYVVLDKTIFHPKGGGQPSDRGKIFSSQFALEMKKAIHHRGAVIHWCKLVSGTVSSGPVSCDVDWSYRCLISRRHTAAHLLDHCLANATSKHVETTDSWLDEPCYVGYRGNAPRHETLQMAQDLANKMITSGASVKINFLNKSDSKSVLQGAPNFERLPEMEEVRVVTIEGCDPIPCGGTHVENIREIRNVSIIKAEATQESTFRLHFSVAD